MLMDRYSPELAVRAGCLLLPGLRKNSFYAITNAWKLP
jgi:hypothetical protein